MPFGISRILCYTGVNGIQKQSLNSTLGKGTLLPQLWREDIHHHCTDWTREMTHNKLQSQVRGRGGGGAEGCLVSALAPILTELCLTRLDTSVPWELTAVSAHCHCHCHCHSAPTMTMQGYTGLASCLQAATKQIIR